MDKITDFCTGCRACEQLCVHHAISMKDNAEGFLVATVQQDLCVDCGLCKKRCPQNSLLKKNKSLRIFAVRLKDDKMLYQSASGGAFAGIAKSWIANGGIVFGVAYDKEWNARHTSASSLEDLKPILSSKYVQADTGYTFGEVKKHLQEGKKVLFSGTGCQIGGLKAFLKKDYDNLLTVDLICHGVASPLLFKKYIAWLGKINSSTIQDYDFRDNQHGWGLGLRYKCENKNIYKSCAIDPYYFSFLEGYTYRESCYQCVYCTPERVGDITIGDYWGIEKEHPKAFSAKGVSCLLINTEKGLQTWEGCKNMFYVTESSFDMVARHNGNLLHPTKRIANIRDHIYEGIQKTNWFGDTFAASFKPSFVARVKNYIPVCLKQFIKKII